MGRPGIGVGESGGEPVRLGGMLLQGNRLNSEMTAKLKESAKREAGLSFRASGFANKDGRRSNP